jgi:calcium-dependent protein kinase
MGQCSCSKVFPPHAFLNTPVHPRNSIVGSDFDATTMVCRMTTKLSIDFVKQNLNKISKDYIISSQILGRGSYGEVRGAKHIPTSSLRAVKIIIKKKFSEKQRHKLIKEVMILKSLDHPNIVKIYEYFQDKDYIYIVMELVRGKELYQYITEAAPLSENLSATIFRQVLAAVSYMHMRNIAHRDLKPENILFDGSVIKIIDFGTAKKFNPTKKMKGFHGSSYYIAPEVIRQSYSKECDVWSCGVILYILLSGSPPFYGNNDAEIFSAISKGEFRMDLKDFEVVSEEVKDLINRMLKKDVRARITIAGALSHPWFNRFGKALAADVDYGILANLKNFKFKSSLQHALYYYMVHRILSDDEKRHVMEIFSALDQNLDGILTKDDIATGLKKAGIELSDDELNHIVFCMDYQQNQQIDFSEFVGGVIDKKKFLNDRNLQMCFRDLDADDDGLIGMNDIQNILQDRKTVDHEYWSELVKDIDTSGDRKISYAEFCKTMEDLIEEDGVHS